MGDAGDVAAGWDRQNCLGCVSRVMRGSSSVSTSSRPQETAAARMRLAWGESSSFTGVSRWRAARALRGAAYCSSRARRVRRHAVLHPAQIPCRPSPLRATFPCQHGCELRHGHGTGSLNVGGGVRWITVDHFCAVGRKQGYRIGVHPNVRIGRAGTGRPSGFVAFHRRHVFGAEPEIRWLLVTALPGDQDLASNVTTGSVRLRPCTPRRILIACCC